jgi:MATE family multidrug resistance protein
MLSIQTVKKIKTLAWPIVLNQLASSLMTTIDTLMVGRLGPQALASMTLAHLLWVLVVIFAIGLFSALSPLLNDALSQNKKIRIRLLVQHALWIALGVTLLAWLMFYLSPWLLRMAGQDPSLIADTRAYLFYFSFGVLGHLLFLVMRYSTEALQHPKPAMWIMVFGLGLNVVLNYGFIYGPGFFPAMGLPGSGLATSLVGWIMAIVAWVYVYRQPAYQSYHFFRGLGRFRPQIFRHMIALGLPLAGMIMAEIGFFLFTALLMGRLGTMELAAHQVTLNIISLTFMVAFGTAQAVSILVSEAAAKQDRGAVRLYIITGFQMVCVSMTCFMVVFLSMPAALVGLYTSDPDVVTIGVQLVMMAGVFQIVDGLQSLGMNICRGLKDTLIPFINIMLAFWLVGAPVSLVLGIYTPLHYRGVWYGLTLALFAASLLHCFRIVHLLKRDRLPAERDESYRHLDSL